MPPPILSPAVGYASALNYQLISDGPKLDCFVFDGKMMSNGVLLNASTATSWGPSGGPEFLPSGFGVIFEFVGVVDTLVGLRGMYPNAELLNLGWYLGPAKFGDAVRYATADRAWVKSVVFVTQFDDVSIYKVALQSNWSFNLSHM